MAGSFPPRSLPGYMCWREFGCGTMEVFPKNKIIALLVGLWCLPTTLIGLIGALLLWPVGWWIVNYRGGVFVVTSRGPIGKWMEGWAAATIGCVVFCWGPPTVMTLQHELRHVRQALCLGPLFLPVYWMLMGCGGYWDHPMERDARIHAGDDR